MFGSIGGKGVGNLRKPVAWKGMGNDQDAGVAAMTLESLDGEAEEIVPIAGDEAPALACGPVELFLVGQAMGTDVVDADGVDATVAEELSHGGADVLVDVVPHRGSSSMRVGCCFATFSRVQAAFRAIC